MIKFRLIGIVAVWLSLGAPAVWAQAKAPMAIAVIDSPVDFAHELLAPFLDVKTLKELRVRDAKGREMSWYDYNQLHARLGAEVSQHGSHVAGIAIRSQAPGSKARLITFPFFSGETRPITPIQLLVANLRGADSVIRDACRKELGTIAAGLRKASVGVVNWSMTTDIEAIFDGLSGNSTLLTNVFLRKKLKLLAATSSKIFREELARFIRQNPGIVFVMAAGNSNQNLKTAEPTRYFSSTLKAGNLVVVGSVSEKGEISPTSNFGPEHVDVLTQGVGVTSVAVGGGTVEMSGTSMAAPAVADKIYELRLAYPKLNAEEAIQKFYQMHTKSYSGLASYSTNGRMYLSAGMDADKLVPLGEITKEPGTRAKRGCSSLKSVLKYASGR